MTKHYMSERDIMKRGLSLLRRCLLPIMLAGLLCSLMSIAAVIIEHIGLEKATAAVAHLSPSEQLLETAENELDAIVALMDARNAYADALDAAYAPWRYLALGVQLLNLLIIPVVTLGLNRGLLRAMNGGQCGLQDVFGGLRGAKRAIGVYFLTYLVTVGVGLAGALLIALLASFLYEGGIIIGGIVALVLQLCMLYRFILADLHCADGGSIDLSATDCLRYANLDKQEYGIIGFLCTLWPAEALTLVGKLLEDLVTAAWVVPVVLLVSFTVRVLYFAILPSIYAFLRSEQELAPGAPMGEGLERARALARSE